MDDELENVKVDINVRFKEDIAWIKRDVMARQIDGDYCKWSNILKTVVVIGLSEAQYRDFWEKQYKRYPRLQKKIAQACTDKFENGLISAEEMIEKIRNSHDYESEKCKAIQLLGGTYTKPGSKGGQ